MDFLGRFLMINTVVLGVALALLAWNWRRTRYEVSTHNRIQPPKPREFTRPGDLEERAKKVMSNAKILVSQGEVNDKDKEKLKVHQEAFYAHYYAANVYRSQETEDSFKAYLKELNLAEEDIAIMKTVLRGYLPSLKSPVLAPSHS